MVKNTDEGYVANITTSFIEIPGKICSSIYFTGCAFNCEGCQNKELQKLTNGKRITTNEVVSEIENNNLAKWVCFLGGEPFFQEEFLFSLCEKISKPIGIYTGNNYDVVNSKYNKIIDLPNVKFLKTGMFDLELIKNNEFPITSNQHVYLKNNNKWTRCTERTISSISNEIEKNNSNVILSKNETMKI